MAGFLPFRALLLIAVLASAGWGFPNGPEASPPARFDTWMDVARAGELASVFGSRERHWFSRQLEAVSPRAAGCPKVNFPRRFRCTDSQRIVQALKTLVCPSLLRGDRAKVSEFLRRINEAALVRSYHFSRLGTGKGRVEFRLADPPRQELEMRHVARRRSRSGMAGPVFGHALSCSRRMPDLKGAFLGGMDLGGEDLRGADLRWADLSGADLSGADLTGTDLTRAKLRGANLGGVNLEGVKGLTKGQLRGVRTDRKTRLPAYLKTLGK